MKHLLTELFYRLSLLTNRKLPKTDMCISISVSNGGLGKVRLTLTDTKLQMPIVYADLSFEGASVLAAQLEAAFNTPTLH